MAMTGDNSVSITERRSRKDRRQLPKFPPLYTPYSRRKKSGRRKTDDGGYVDVYDFRTWDLALSVMILSILDGILTSLEISVKGAEEMNPLMKHLLQAGGSFFFLALKLTLTSLALAVIVLHKEFRIGRNAARFCLWSYIIIAIYHLYLILWWPYMAGH
jgi:hypothetical protein